MDKETEKRALKALEREKNQYSRQNNWISANRERQTVTFPLGTREKIALYCPGESVNGYINKLVASDLEKRAKIEECGGE